MAKIELGMATSHGPLLSTPPEQWGERAKADRANPALWFRGQPYKYDALETLRAGEGLEVRSGLPERQARYARCRKALEALAATFEKVNPDVVVIVGNDQQEVFCDKNMPAFSIYWGDAVANRPPTDAADGQDAAGVVARDVRASAAAADAVSVCPGSRPSHHRQDDGEGVRCRDQQDFAERRARMGA